MIPQLEVTIIQHQAVGLMVHQLAAIIIQLHPGATHIPRHLVVIRRRRMVHQATERPQRVIALHHMALPLMELHLNTAHQAMALRTQLPHLAHLPNKIFFKECGLAFQVYSDNNSCL